MAAKFRADAALLLALVALSPLAAAAAAAAENELLVAAHEPSYFLLGHRDDVSTARFQFSFKYKLFDRDSVPTTWLPPLSGLHFAYTQTAVWDLSAPSKPFRDTSYRPALLWDWAGKDQAGGAPVWSAQAGFEHESNGKRDSESRSINIAYLEPRWRTTLGDDGFLQFGARLFGYLDRSENPDIADYRGYATWLISAGRADGAQYRLAWRQGSKPERYSLQIDASYPLRRQYFANTGGYIYGQIFTGYGETLLDYRVKRAPQIRLGFAVVR